MRAAAALLLLATPALAQELPPANGADGRYLTIAYVADGLFQLPTASKTAQTLVFAPGEQIRSVQVGDPAAFAIGVTGSGDSMTVVPNGIWAQTYMDVRTDRRSYRFELIPAQAADAPAVVRFSYDVARPAAEVPAPGPQPEGISYQLSGAKSLRPATISDDGAKTYITWDEEQAMPAVFAIGPSGKEEMVEGYVRRGVFTIDRVYAQLVFRIDQETAKAKRLNRRVRK